MLRQVELMPMEIGESVQPRQNLLRHGNPSERFTKTKAFKV